MTNNRARTTYFDMLEHQTDQRGVQAWLVSDIARRARKLTDRRRRVLTRLAAEQARQGNLTAALHAMETAERMDRPTALNC